jgi:hypothetical protein
LYEAVVDGMDEREKDKLRNIAAMRLETHNQKGGWESRIYQTLNLTNRTEP